MRTDIGHTRITSEIGQMADVVQRLAPHGGEEGDVVRVAQILLRDLQLGHQARAGHGVEERRNRLARLEVDGAVLDLDDDVRGKLSVERGELDVGLLGAVRVIGRIDKSPPDDLAAVWTQRIGQEICPLGMRTAEVARAGLTLAVGLDQKAAEVGDATVDVVHLVLPPVLDGGFERVGGLGCGQCHGRREVDREPDADAVGTEQVGVHRGRVEIGIGQDLRRGVHVVQNRPVDAYGLVPLAVGFYGQCVNPATRPEEAAAGVATFHGAVQVVPMVQHTERLDRLWLGGSTGGHVQRKGEGKATCPGHR